MHRRRSRLLVATRGKFGFLLVALIALLVTAPVVAEGLAWRAAINLFVACVLVAGLYAVRPGRRSLIAGLVLAAVEFTIGRLAIAHASYGLILVQIVLWLVALVYVTVEILEWVLDSPEVTLETLQAAFCVYLLLGLFWAYLYALMEVATPDSFRVLRGPAIVWTDEGSRRLGFMRLFVYSYATLTGTGQGGLEAANGFAEMAASLEAMSAQIYLAVVIARLVGITSSPPMPGPGRSP
jgi:hypothetical protein